MTTDTIYGKIQNGDTIMIQGIPMVVSNLHTDDLAGGKAIRFTGTFDEKQHAWAKGYSGSTFGAYPWVKCVKA